MERFSFILTNWREGDDEKIRRISGGGGGIERLEKLRRSGGGGERKSGGGGEMRKSTGGEERRSGGGEMRRSGGGEEGGEREKRYILDRVIRETSVPDLKIFSSLKVKIKFEFEKFSTSVYVVLEMKVFFKYVNIRMIFIFDPFF